MRLRPYEECKKQQGNTHLSIRFPMRMMEDRSSVAQPIQRVIFAIQAWRIAVFEEHGISIRAVSHDSKTDRPSLSPDAQRTLEYVVPLVVLGKARAKRARSLIACVNQRKMR